MDTSSSIKTPATAINAGTDKVVQLPSFDEVMAELMLQLAIRDISRKADARLQRRLRVAKDRVAR